MTVVNTKSQFRPIHNRILFQAGMAFFCAAASIVCYRTGFLYIFFLLPLAVCAVLEGAKTALAAGMLGIAFNAAVSVWFFMYRGEELLILRWNMVHYVIMVIVFTWVNAPPGRFSLFREIPCRMAAGAVFCVILLLPVFYFIVKENSLHILFTKQLETFGSFAEGSAPPAEKLVSAAIHFGLRGGILFYCMVYWFINRQFALLICRIFRNRSAHQRNGAAPDSGWFSENSGLYPENSGVYPETGGYPENSGLTGETPEDRNSSADVVIQTGKFLNFRAPFFLVWVLSVSLGAILLGKTGKIELLEICSWNVLVVSATLFLVQGGAIMFHFLLRLPPLLRILINVGIIILFFRPGINMALLGILVLLGIMENWVPFRAPKQ